MVTIQLNLVAPLNDSLMMIENINVLSLMILYLARGAPNCLLMKRGRKISSCGWITGRYLDNMDWDGMEYTVGNGVAAALLL